VTATTDRRFRSRDCFADPPPSDIIARTFERLINCDLRPGERRPGRSIVGIAHAGQLADGAHLDFAVDHRRIAEPSPRHNHRQG